MRRDREVLEGKEGRQYILDFYKQEYSDLTYPVEKGRVITWEGESWPEPDSEEVGHDAMQELEGLSLRKKSGHLQGEQQGNRQ